MTPRIDSANAYEILGLERAASAPEIRLAFRKLALRYHPDAVPAEEKAQASEVFARINQAHEVLRDAQRRRRYDALLDRGITPDLFQEFGDVGPVASLASIIGEVRSLGIDPTKARGEPDPGRFVDAKLWSLVEPTLIREGQVKESVVDVISVAGVNACRGIKPAPGVGGGWLVVTELRIFALLRFVHTYDQGNTRYTETNYRAAAFWHGTLERMIIHEEGRVSRKYRLELKDEGELHFDLGLVSPVRLSRLMLVANVYKLPLCVRAAADIESESGEILTAAFVPPLLWCVPYALELFYHICNYLDCRHERTFLKEFTPFEGWLETWTTMTGAGLTTLAIYLPGILYAASRLHLHAAWHVARAEQILGTLAIDFADGTVLAPSSRAGASGADTPGTTTAAAATQAGRPQQAPPIASRSTPPPAAASSPASTPPAPGQARPTPPPSRATPPPGPPAGPPPGQHGAAGPGVKQTPPAAPAAPLRIQMPAAVAEAMGRAPEAAAAGPSRDEAAQDKERLSEIFDSGMAAIKASDYETALDRFNEYLAARPDSSNALYNRGLSRYNLKKYGEALTDFLGYLDRYPDDVDALSMAGKSRFFSDDKRGALALFDRLLRLKPDHQSACHYRGRCYQAMARWKEAIADFTRALQLDPTSYENYYNRAWPRGKVGDHQGAVEDYDRYLEQFPKDAWSYAYRGHRRLDLGHYTRAIEDYRRAIELDAEGCKEISSFLDLAEKIERLTREGKTQELLVIFCDRGWIKGRAEEPENAAIWFNRALDLDRGHAPAWHGRGAARGTMGQYAEAIDDFTKAIQLDARFALAHKDRGRARRLAADMKGALEDTTRAISLGSDDPDAFFQRALVRYNLGDDEGTVQDYARVLDREPKNTGALYNRALALARLSRHRAALADLDTLLKLEPSNTDAYAQRAKARAALRDRAGAIADYRKASELTPSRAAEFDKAIAQL